MVEAAKEWIDANLPPDIGERREAHHDTPTSTTTSTHPHTPTPHTPAHAGPGAPHHHPSSAAATSSSHSGPAVVSIAAAAATPGVINLGWGATALGISTATGAAGNDTWWSREEADPQLIRDAIAEAAAAAPWRTGRAEAAALGAEDEEAAEGLQVGLRLLSLRKRCKGSVLMIGLLVQQLGNLYCFLN